MMRTLRSIVDGLVVAGIIGVVVIRVALSFPKATPSKPG